MENTLRWGIWWLCGVVWCLVTGLGLVQQSRTGRRGASWLRGGGTPNPAAGPGTKRRRPTNCVFIATRISPIHPAPEHLASCPQNLVYSLYPGQLHLGPALPPGQQCAALAPPQQTRRNSKSADVSLRKPTGSTASTRAPQGQPDSRSEPVPNCMYAIAAIHR